MYRNVSEILENTAKKYPNRIALESADEKLTYKEVWQQSLYIAGIIAQKSKINTPVIMIIPRSVLAFETMIAIAYSGNYWVWLDDSLPDQRKIDILNQFDDYLIVTDRQPKPIYDFERCIMIDHDALRFFEEKGQIQESAGCERISAEKCKVAAGMHPVKSPNHRSPKMAIVFTSGTTGIPKGVMLTHEGMIRHAESDCRKYSDYYLSVLNLYSAYSIGTLTYFFDVIYMGGVYHIAPEDIFFSPLKLKNALESNVRSLCCPPPVIEMILSNRQLQTTPPEAIFSGGAHLSSQLTERVFEWNERIALFNSYGSTETYGGVFTGNVDPAKTDDCAIGDAHPSVSYELLDGDGNAVTGDGRGELCIFAPFIQPEYYNDPDETQRKRYYSAKEQTSEYRTGDLFRREGNNLFYEGRVDNQIKRWGHRIELEDIDRCVERIPGVEKAVSVFDADTEDLFLGYIGNLTEAELNKLLLRSMPAHMRPSRSVSLDTIPVNQNGKTDRKALLRRIRNGDRAE